MVNPYQFIQNTYQWNFRTIYLKSYERCFRSFYPLLNEKKPSQSNKALIATEGY